MRTAAAQLACAVIAYALTGATYGQDRKGEPFELVRSLQSLQDQVIQGNGSAHAAQRVLLGQIAEEFDAVSPDRLKDPRNVRAAIVFVFNGGSARALQKLIRSGAGTAVDEKLLKGALAYGEGRRDEAADLLSEVDARILDPGLAGHVAYIQGELTAKKAPAKALAYLDDARLLSPGTIVEEAALRREIALLAAAGNVDSYESLATQYLRRFPNSVYAGGFRQQFAAAIATATNAGEPGRLARLEAMLGGVEQSNLREVYLTIAQQALGKGNLGMARFAAVNAARLAEEGSVERERARLYQAAALIVTDEFGQAVEILKAADRSKLADADVALLKAAVAIAEQVRREPDPAASESAPPPDRAGLIEGEVMERARKTIAQVDEMLGGAER